MTLFYFAAAGLLGLVVTCAAIVLAGLFLRNPLAPAWVQSEAVATGAGLVLTVGICLAVAYAVSGLEAASLSYRTIAPLVAGVPAATTLLLWNAFDIGDRLAQAEAGHSPFGRARPSETAIVAGV